MATVKMGLRAFPKKLSIFQLLNIRSYCKTNSSETEPSRKYEVSRDPQEWQHVLRLLPSKTVPSPTEKATYPSGWTPQKESALNEPYFIARNKNHMRSLYLQNLLYGQLKITVIKRIEGDIWRLHDELKAYIESKKGKRIASQVQEAHRVIKFKGDHYHWAEEWMISKGF